MINEFFEQFCLLADIQYVQVPTLVRSILTHLIDFAATDRLAYEQML